MGDQRSHTAGRFALEVDSWNVGYLKKFTGLSMEAEIATHDMGPDNVQTKNVAKVKWTPGTASVGIAMGKGMYDWIKAAFDKGYMTKSGILRAADFNYKEQSQLTFQDALITGVTVPVLEGASKEPAYFDITFDAEQVRWAPGNNQDIKAKIGTNQKAWLCSNYSVEMPDLPCKRIAKVAGGDGKGLNWQCSVVPDELGMFREPTKHPAKVTVPDITFSISYADHKDWADRAKKWFVDGEHLEDHHMDGRLVFLNPNMKDEIGSIDLLRCGFKSIKDQDLQANSETIKRFDVTMYVEKMQFNIKLYDA